MLSSVFFFTGFCFAFCFIFCWRDSVIFGRLFSSRSTASPEEKKTVQDSWPAYIPQLTAELLHRINTTVPSYHISGTFPRSL